MTTENQSPVPAPAPEGGPALSAEDRTRALNLAYQFRSHPASRSIDDIEQAGEIILSLLGRPVMLNGLTEAETAQTASVKGLTQAPAEGDADADDDALTAAYMAGSHGARKALDLLEQAIQWMDTNYERPSAIRDEARALIAASRANEPQPKGTDAGRAAALEESAQLCELWNTTPGKKLAGEIRALATQAPAPAPWPMEVQPDGSVTPVQPEDLMFNGMTREETDATASVFGLTTDAESWRRLEPFLGKDLPNEEVVRLSEVKELLASQAPAVQDGKEQP